MNFITSDKLITIFGEENILVSELCSFWYIEADEETEEVPFHALEVTSVIQTSQDKNEMPKGSISSWTNVEAAIEAGFPLGWDKMIKVMEKKDRFRLGYQHSFKQT